MHVPTLEHHHVAHRILRYIKGTPRRGLFFPSSSNLQTKWFCDLDWATFPQRTRSTTRFYVFLGSLLISWKSKKQSIVSQFSSEARYHALDTLVYDVQWLTYLINEFNVLTETPAATIYCDNQYARYIAHNPNFHKRTKHIMIDFHVVHEKLQSKFFQLLPISSIHQAAFVFTKLLDRRVFTYVVSKLGLIDIYHKSWGGAIKFCNPFSLC